MDQASDLKSLLDKQIRDFDNRETTKDTDIALMGHQVYAVRRMVEVESGFDIVDLKHTKTSLSLDDAIKAASVSNEQDEGLSVYVKHNAAVLSAPTGSGKTFMMLFLIKFFSHVCKSTQDFILPFSNMFSTFYHRGKTTGYNLIVVPNHLVSQWKSEADKININSKLITFSTDLSFLLDENRNNTVLFIRTKDYNKIVKTNMNIVNKIMFERVVIDEADSQSLRIIPTKMFWFFSATMDKLFMKMTEKESGFLGVRGTFFWALKQAVLSSCANNDVYPTNYIVEIKNLDFEPPKINMHELSINLCFEQFPKLTNIVKKIIFFRDIESYSDLITHTVQTTSVPQQGFGGEFIGFMCKMCGKIFKYEKQLTDHIQDFKYTPENVVAATTKTSFLNAASEQADLIFKGLVEQFGLNMRMLLFFPTLLTTDVLRLLIKKINASHIPTFTLNQQSDREIRKLSDFCKSEKKYVVVVGKRTITGLNFHELFDQVSFINYVIEPDHKPDLKNRNGCFYYFDSSFVFTPAEMKQGVGRLVRYPRTEPVGVGVVNVTNVNVNNLPAFSLKRKNFEEDYCNNIADDSIFVKQTKK